MFFIYKWRCDMFLVINKDGMLIWLGRWLRYWQFSATISQSHLLFSYRNSTRIASFKTLRPTAG